MTALPDAKFAALRGLGYTGAMPDMELQWLLANGASSPSLSDAWQEMLAAQLSVPKDTVQVNDGWHELLRQLGYVGQVNDAELLFWEAGGTFPP